jgi:hypothetical protein
MPFTIPRWVPPAAADNIRWRATLPGSAARDIALLERLATSDVMRTVWPKLTSLDAGEIVNVILRAGEAARDLRPPFPKRTKDRAAYLQETRLFPPRPGGVAVLVEKAVQDMREFEPEARLLWSQLWAGQRDITYDKLLPILSAVAEFYQSLEVKYHEAGAAAPPLPAPPRKRGSKTARQTYFGRILSDYFKRTGGYPLDDVVGAVTGVVFDDASGGPSAETQRGRRRTDAKPIKRSGRFCRRGA